MFGRRRLQQNAEAYAANQVERRSNVARKSSDTVVCGGSTKRTKGLIPDALSNISTLIPTREQQEMFNLIEEEEWDPVLMALRSRRGKQISTWRDKTGLTLLGLALGSRAPKEIVQLLLHLNPDAVLSRDSYGAMPLHLGCLNGIAAESIQMIIEIDGGLSARAPDNDNRTALHHTVELCCILALKLDDASELSVAYEQSIEALELILSVAPETVHVITNSGDTPLDIPQLIRLRRNVDENVYLDEIYRLLKETSIEIYQKNKLIWESTSVLPGMIGKDDHQESGSTPSLYPSMASTSSASATTFHSDLYADLDKTRSKLW